MTRPTMKDVAAEAGVSQATVSLVLNKKAGHGRVSSATAQRVQDAAHKLGFRKNIHAQNLREGSSRLIGFIGDEVITTPFAGDMVLGAQREAWKRGHVLLTLDTTGDDDLERAAISMMQEYRVQGIVYAAMYHRKLTLPAALKNTPTVLVNAQDTSEKHSSIFPDEVTGGREAAKALLNAGHRRVAMINIDHPDSQLPAAHGRLRGFTDYLEEHEDRVQSVDIGYGTGGFEDGLREGLRLLQLPNRPTAIFCGNDRTALGLYQAASKLRLSIPDDLSIVGFDDQPLVNSFFTPKLSTFQLPHEEMGRVAIEELLSPPASPRRICVACTYHPKDSISPRENRP